jgi:hypothetical protein
VLKKVDIAGAEVLFIVLLEIQVLDPLIQLVHILAQLVVALVAQLQEVGVQLVLIILYVGVRTLVQDLVQVLLEVGVCVRTRLLDL